MIDRRQFVGGVLGATTLAATATAIPGISFAAEEIYPARPITFIVPWGAGGGADQLARQVSRLIEPKLKVSVPIINVPGATGQNGLSKLITSPADGYSLAILIGDSEALFIGQQARLKSEDFLPLGVMMQQPSGFFVNVNSPWQTWDDVKKAATEKPLRVAILGYGGSDDLTVKYLRAKGLKLESIPFAEPGLRYSSVIGGQSDILFEQAGDVRSFLDGKQMRPVLFFSREPFEYFPDVPYSKALGYEVYLPQFRAIVARAGTAPAQVKIFRKPLIAPQKLPNSRII